MEETEERLNFTTYLIGAKPRELRGTPKVKKRVGALVNNKARRCTITYHAQ